MELVTIFWYAFIGWTLCAATMSIGLAIMPLSTALTIHVVSAPIFFTLLTVSYFKKFNDKTPLQTAFVFVGVVMTFDFFVGVLLIHRSVEMFASLLETWIPLALISVNKYRKRHLPFHQCQQMQRRCLLKMSEYFPSPPEEHVALAISVTASTVSNP
jgi:hypothetical protein